jgi:hypothetical protein
MTMYQLLPDFMGQPAQCIKRLSDNAFIPFDPANTDYADVSGMAGRGQRAKSR